MPADTISESSLKFLDEAKKGTPEHFLLACKRSKIQSLTITKQPSPKAGASKEGLYFGIITGKGQELAFNLALADGFTYVPATDKLLREFLKAEAADTGVDLGFPKAQAVKNNGTAGALIEGIRGKDLDPMALRQMKWDSAPQHEIDDYTQKLLHVPDQVTAQSLQKVVLTNIVTCQWDCKWGNMMIDGNNARPIDGGGAFPTQTTIDNFCRDVVRGKQIFPLIQLTEFPGFDGNPKNDQVLPQAQQPMDAVLVQAILNINVDGLKTAVQTRRDQLVQGIPELAGPQGPQSLLDNASINNAGESIQAAQHILRNHPQITLRQFVQEYETWVKTWLAARTTPAPARP